MMNWRPDDEGRLTEAQVDARKRAMQILEDHFDAGLIVVSAAIEDKNDDSKSEEGTYVSHFGGHASAIGLACLAKSDLLTPDEQDES
jgi:hypothetical protein